MLRQRSRSRNLAVDSVGFFGRGWFGARTPTSDGAATVGPRPPALSSPSWGAPTRSAKAARHLHRARPVSAPPHRSRVLAHAVALCIAPGAPERTRLVPSADAVGVTPPPPDASLEPKGLVVDDQVVDLHLRAVGADGIG